MEMTIEVVDKLAQKIPWHRRSSNVAVGRHDALDIGNEVMNKMLQLARDCIHCHQGVAFVSAVRVAHGFNCVQLLLQLRRKAEVVGLREVVGHRQRKSKHTDMRDTDGASKILFSGRPDD